MSLDVGDVSPALPDDPVHEAALLRRAADLAEAYQVVLRCEDGRYYGWGLELPDAMNYGRTADECVHATRDTMAQHVARMLRAGVKPPAPTLDVDRTQQITVRVTPAERSLLERAARAQGSRGAAEFIRQVGLDRAGVLDALPAPPPKVAEASPDPARQRRRVAWARGMVAVGWCIALVAAVIVAFEVESVLASGPVLLLAGIVLAGLGARSNYRLATLVGVAHGGICLFVFALVNVAEWGPSQARAPLTVIGALYVLVTLPLSAYAWLNPPREVDPGVCAQCGYSLYGLHEPRCPECGSAFDPKLLLSLTPLKVWSARSKLPERWGS